MSRHEALNPDDHRDLRIQERRDAALGDARMVCIVVPAEFRALQAEYPILFRLNETRDRFSALAMFGFENGENLYLADGRWDARYRPLAIDIQPFLIGGRPDEDGPKQIHVDVDSPRIATGDEGVRVFDKHGRPTPYLERVIEQIGELDHGFRESGDFFAALQRHELLEPFTLEVTLEDRSDNRLVGYHIIDEARLNSLSGTALAELQAAGHLEPIYMAMASLSQFSALIARRNRRAARG